MPLKENELYELTLILRFDDLDTLPRLLKEVSKRVCKIRASKLDENGGEESGARAFVAGWYDFNLRDRNQVSDEPTATKLPIRPNLEAKS